MGTRPEFASPLLIHYGAYSPLCSARSIDSQKAAEWVSSTKRQVVHDAAQPAVVRRGHRGRTRQGRSLPSGESDSCCLHDDGQQKRGGPPIPRAAPVAAVQASVLDRLQRNG